MLLLSTAFPCSPTQGASQKPRHQSTSPDKADPCCHHRVLEEDESQHSSSCSAAGQICSFRSPPSTQPLSFLEVGTQFTQSSTTFSDFNLATRFRRHLESWNPQGWKKPPRPSSPALCAADSVRALGPLGFQKPECLKITQGDGQIHHQEHFGSLWW